MCALVAAITLKCAVAYAAPTQGLAQGTYAQFQSPGCALFDPMRPGVHFVKSIRQGRYRETPQGKVWVPGLPGRDTVVPVSI
jgi:hypothetical protein